MTNPASNYQNTRKTPLWLYPLFLIVVYSSWLFAVVSQNLWHLFESYWPMSLTMTAGSFVAGATPTGGAAVAFPVFTKVLQIPTNEARTFGLMIQSIGMTSAALFILHKRLTVLWQPIIFASIGGALGMLVAIYGIQLPSPYPRVLFSLMLALLGFALIYCHRHSGMFALLPHPVNRSPFRLKPIRQFEFFFLGFIGGLISENTGSGVDIMVFMSLALAYRMPEKISIPTSVICMAINAVVGFLLHATLVKDIDAVLPYWMVCVPIVAVGAPLGAWFVNRCSRKQIISFVLVLISIDVISTLVLIDMRDYLHLGLIGFLFVCTMFMVALILRGNRRLLRRSR